MSLFDVSEFVPDVEVDRLWTVGHGVDDVRVEHDEVPAQKPRGEGIQKAAAVDQVGVGSVTQAEGLAAGEMPVVKVGELGGGELDAVALEMGDECGLTYQEGDAESGQQEHENAFGREEQPQPVNRCHHGVDHEETLLPVVDDGAQLDVGDAA